MTRRAARVLQRERLVAMRTGMKVNVHATWCTAQPGIGWIEATRTHGVPSRSRMIRRAARVLQRERLVAMRTGMKVNVHATWCTAQPGVGCPEATWIHDVPSRSRMTRRVARAVQGERLHVPCRAGLKRHGPCARHVRVLARGAE